MLFLAFSVDEYFKHGIVLFVKGPNVEEFQLVADSIVSLRNLVAKIAAGLPPQDESESTTTQKNNVCRSYIFCCSFIVILLHAICHSVQFAECAAQFEFEIVHSHFANY